MKNLLNALLHCHYSNGDCWGCPYEHNKEKCENLYEDVEKVFVKIGEFIDFEDVRNITEIIIKKGKEIKNERKN